MASPPSTAPSTSYPSLELCFDLARDQLDAQSKRASNLDTKASFVLGSASILTTTAVAFKAAFTSAQATNLGMIVLAIAGAAAYVGVVGSAFMAYTLRSYAWVPQVSELKAHYMTKPLEYTRGTLLSSMVIAFTENERTIGRKVVWTRAALMTLLVEAAIVALLVVVQILLPAAAAPAAAAPCVLVTPTPH
jgi:hypothetical protein